VIEQIGALTNTVPTGKDSFSWLDAPTPDVIASGMPRCHRGISDAPSP
jgi:hypothetical protein